MQRKKGTLKRGYQNAEGLLGRHRNDVTEKEDEIDVGTEHEGPGQIYRETDEATGQDGDREIQVPCPHAAGDTEKHVAVTQQNTVMGTCKGTEVRRGGGSTGKTQVESPGNLVTKRNPRGKSRDTVGSMEEGSVVGTRWHMSCLNAS